jgi:hypothetical protein
LIIIEIKSSIYRHYLTRKYYNIAIEIAKNKNKKLMVIGDPCVGNINMFIQKIYPNCKHGYVTIDLFGCNKCDKMNINNIQEWKKYKSNNYVIVETGTLSFSNDIILVLKEINRISGGDFLSSGGTISYFWKYIGYYLYSKNYPNPIKYIIYPFDYRKNNKYKVYDLIEKKIKFIDF